MSNDQSRLQLVFDVGGVLAANLDGFWSGMAETAKMERSDLRARYKREIGPGLWRGTVTEEQFWNWLSGVCPAVTTAEAKRLLTRVLVPLPALGKLERWSADADIHILSNHVTAWIMPLFEGLEARISSVTVSSEAGYHKPEPQLYEAAALGLNGSDVCFVDDKIANLEAARKLGWDTLLADAEGVWTEKIDRMLGTHA
ncbi:HAD-IA family hydrolase [Saccharibacillus alkalitolerans]|uniref:HAD-IA family hydrolase n=1 Tax=Saccharibacillus alkalitolerans TaxID=2705290 RepID=A0ABX0F8S5_9BACL|nr:HAD-IA family hydrolase [Saccharibacillus alkalitolerans]NGZ75611.1 HAD-IA family hydrolase [Saccharibacillus alkalitolerans]